MDKFLKVTGNVLSILSVLVFIAYVGLNTAYDISAVYQDGNADMFKSIRNMLLVPGFLTAILGLAVSTAYVVPRKDELSNLEIGVAIGTPVLVSAGLALFAFVL